VIYLLFLLSGLSGLIYQVIWVREFGNVFGNTIHSASLVVAVFMLGLGAGSYLVGSWADRRYAAEPDSLLRAYGYVEIVIALTASNSEDRHSVDGQPRWLDATPRESALRERSHPWHAACSLGKGCSTATDSLLLIYPSH
jgi:hypothetical protein